MSGNRIWLFGSVIVIIGVIVLGWFLGVSPKLAEAQLAADQQSVVDTQNIAQEATLVTLREQNAQLEELKAELLELQGTVPDQAKVDAFVDEVQALASAQSLVLASATVAEAVAFAGAPVEGAAATENAPTEGSIQPSAALAPLLFTIPVTMEIDGPLPNLLAFTKSLQTGKRLFLLTGVTYELGKATLVGDLFVVYKPSTIVEEPETEEVTATPAPTPSEEPAE